MFQKRLINIKNEVVLLGDRFCGERGGDDLVVTLWYRGNLHCSDFLVELLSPQMLKRFQG